MMLPGEDRDRFFRRMNDIYPNGIKEVKDVWSFFEDREPRWLDEHLAIFVSATLLRASIFKIDIPTACDAVWHTTRARKELP